MAFADVAEVDRVLELQPQALHLRTGFHVLPLIDHDEVLEAFGPVEVDHRHDSFAEVLHSLLSRLIVLHGEHPIMAVPKIQDLNLVEGDTDLGAVQELLLNSSLVVVEFPALVLDDHRLVMQKFLLLKPLLSDVANRLANLNSHYRVPAFNSDDFNRILPEE